MMFQPDKFLPHVKSEGIVKFTYDVIMRCPEDKQELLWKNVILSGGNTTFRGDPCVIFVTKLIRFRGEI
jgi:hypothetical protein